jgi:hypothetical protein
MELIVQGMIVYRTDRARGARSCNKSSENTRQSKTNRLDAASRGENIVEGGIVRRDGGPDSDANVELSSTV